MIGNNNPNFLEFARLVSRKSFHYLISTITSSGASGISIRRIRDEKPYTYFYSTFVDIADERKECLLWRFFNARHEELFKPGSHITVMVPEVPAVVSKAENDYGTCVLSQVPQAEFNLVCGTAGTVQSGKSNLMSL